MPRRLFFAGVFCAGLAACGGGSDGGTAAPAPLPPLAPIALTIDGLPADANVFDPAPAQAAGDARIWMSYSHVTPTTVDPRFIDVNTRIASSTDGGATWQDTGGFITAAQTTTAPAPHAAKPARWIHEVSQLAYDPHVAGGQWILLWHRYMSAFDAASGATLSLFEHGWIGLKIAATPAGLATAPERKLFVGLGYSNVNDGVLGAPEFRLDQLFPGPTKLGSCLAFSEPAVLVTAAGIHVALKCATGTSTGKISSLRCEHAFAAGSCSYLGDFLSDSEAAELNSSWSGFSAPGFISTANANWLIVSPFSADAYRGCLLMRVISLDAATVTRSAGAPVVEGSIAPSGDFNGACGYVPGLTATGIIVGQATFGAPPSFRLWGSRIVPPK